MSSLRVAFYGTDLHGKWTVMLTEDRADPNRPGWSQSATKRFIEAESEDRALSMANSLKQRGEADLVRRLGH